jgi:peptide/nickel transport system substrate-binding protein
MGISQIPVENLSRALDAPELNLYSSRFPELTLVLFNLTNEDVPFFQDLEVRRALYMGLNRQSMIDRILDGQAIMANGPIFPGTWAYYDGQNPVTYNPEEAIGILRRAGYTIPAEGGNVRAKDGVRLNFELVHPDTESHTQLAEAIQAYWEDLGVQVTLKGVSYANLVDEYLEPRSYQAVLVDYTTASSPDPDPYPFWHQAQTPNGQNYANWDDRSASEYLEQARVAVDPGERERLYKNFQVRFGQELPALPLFYPVFTFAIDNQVQGVKTGPLFEMSDRFAHIMEWYLFIERNVEQAEITPTPLP